MIVILSPAKNLDFQSPISILPGSDILYPSQARKLIGKLKKLSREDLMELMHINPKLAELNYARYHEWSKDHTAKNSRQAILAFNGEVYNGLQAKNFKEDDLLFAQDHVRILSGLYGILRPLDRVQPYRLEMGTSLEVDQHQNLYEFWGNKLLHHLKELKKQDNEVLINLASNEYAKAAKLDKFKGRIITPVFKQFKGDKLTTITIYMKKARGLMTRFIIENRISDPENLKLFDTEGYFYNENLSDDTQWVFTR